MFRRVPDGLTRCLARRRLVSAAVALLIGLASVSLARAEVQVGGSAQVIQVDARDSSVAEILAALARAFDLRYQDSDMLDRSVDGVFRGSLVQVLSRLLEDYDYVLRRSESGPFEVIYMRPRGSDVPGVHGAKPPSERASRAAEADNHDMSTESRPLWSRNLVAHTPDEAYVGFGPGGYRCHRRPSACPPEEKR